MLPPPRREPGAGRHGQKLGKKDDPPHLSFRLLGTVTPGPWEETQTQRIARKQETSCLAGGSPKAVLGDFVSPVHVQRNQREGGSVGCCL